jgi:hypothetical protein
MPLRLKGRYFAPGALGKTGRGINFSFELDPHLNPIRPSPAGADDGQSGLENLRKPKILAHHQFPESPNTGELFYPFGEGVGIALEGSEDLPAIFEDPKPAAERDLVRYATEELLGWDVKRVFVEMGSYCGHGMGAEDIEKNFRRKPADVVLAKANASGAGKEVVQEGLVLDESLGAGKAAQGPGHLAGGPKPGESLVQRFFCVLAEEVDHGLGVESPLRR